MRKAREDKQSQRSPSQRSASSSQRGSSSSQHSPPPGDAYAARLAQAKSESVGQLLLKCARLFNQEALERVQPSSSIRLRSAHTALFPHIDLDGTRLTEVARRASISKQAVGQLITELESLGVVERLSDPSDARARLVRFTELGRAGLLRGLGLLDELGQELAAEVGTAEMRELKRLLQRLLATLESRAAEKQSS